MNIVPRRTADSTSQGHSSFSETPFVPRPLDSRSSSFVMEEDLDATDLLKPRRPRRSSLLFAILTSSVPGMFPLRPPPPAIPPLRAVRPPLYVSRSLPMDHSSPCLPSEFQLSRLARAFVPNTGVVSPFGPRLLSRGSPAALTSEFGWNFSSSCSCPHAPWRF